MKLTALFLLLAVLIGLVGCAPIPAAQPGATEAPATFLPPTVEPATATVASTSTSTPEPTLTPTAEATTAPTPTPTAPATAVTSTPAPGAAPEPAVPAGFTTHRDPVAGFAIDYPADWSITVPPVESRPQAQAYTASIRSGSPASDPPIGQPVPPGETGIDVTVVRTQAATLEEALAERHAEILNSELGVTITSEEMVELTGGLRAVRRQLATAQAGAVAELTTFLGGNRIMVHGMGNLDQFDAIARSLRPIGPEPVGTGTPAAGITPGAGATYTDAPLGFSAVIPAEWELCTNTALSRLFCRIQAVPTGPEFPRFYLTVLPVGFTNEDASAYNFLSEDDVKTLMALPVGQSFATEVLPEYSTFTRLPDTTVSGLAAAVFENARVWEGGPDTKDRRVLTKVGTSTYMFGTYYETAEELAEFEQVLAGVQITAR